MTHALRSVFGKATAAIVGLAFTVSAGSALAAEKIPFTLNWKIGGSHGIIFLAVDRGYFASEGLELDIVAGDGSANVVNRLASGAYQIGMGDVAAVVRFNAQNPTKRVKAIYNQTPADLAVVSLKGRGITKPADLKGRIVGAPVGDSAYKMFPAFSTATGVKASDLKWEHMAPNIREAMLIQGKVDAITANEGTALFALMAAGIKESDMVFIRYAEQGLNFVNGGLMANESYIKERPDVVRKIVKGYHRATLDTIVNPDAAIDAVMKRDPLLIRNLEKGRLMYSLKLQIEQPDTKEGGLGFFAEKNVARSIDIVSEAENLSPKIAVADLVDLSFLPPLAERAVPTQKTN
jgi:NitT/TauT family transport system substrate-binding protein